MLVDYLPSNKENITNKSISKNEYKNEVLIITSTLLLFFL